MVGPPATSPTSLVMTGTLTGTSRTVSAESLRAKGATTTVTVPVAQRGTDPLSHPVTVNSSTPVVVPVGTYSKTPSALTVTVPLAGWLLSSVVTSWPSESP